MLRKWREKRYLKAVLKEFQEIEKKYEKQWEEINQEFIKETLIENAGEETYIDMRTDLQVLMIENSMNIKKVIEKLENL